VSGSDWVAVAGIASGVVVTIAVTVLNLWYGARLQARREQRGELRNVLDLAAAAVSEAVGAAGRRVVATGDAVDETGESFEDKHGAVRVFEHRIAIRLGKDDAVTEAFQRVEAQLDKVSKELFAAHGALDDNAQKSTNEQIKRVRELQLVYLEGARELVNRGA
jgi:hypothetical protein